VLALDSVVAWSVTVTTLNSYAGSVGAGGVVGAGVGSVIAARKTTGAAGAEIIGEKFQLGDEIGTIRIEAIRITGTAETDALVTGALNETEATRATVAVETGAGAT
jgi:hypothetical protein